MNSQDDTHASSKEVNDAKKKGSRRHRGSGGGRGGRGGRGSEAGRQSRKTNGRSNGREGDGREKDNAAESPSNLKEGEGKQGQGGKGKSGRGGGRKEKGGLGHGGRGGGGGSGALRSVRRGRGKVSDETKSTNNNAASSAQHQSGDGEKKTENSVTNEATASSPPLPSSNQNSDRKHKGNQSRQQQKEHHQKKRSHAKSGKKGENKGEKSESKETETLPKNEHTSQQKSAKKGPSRGKNARKRSQQSGGKDEGSMENLEEKDSSAKAKSTAQKDERKGNRRRNSRKNSKKDKQKSENQTSVKNSATTSANSNDQGDTSLYFEQPTLEDLEMLSAPKTKTTTKKKRKSRSKKISYADYIPLSDCLSRYGDKDPSLVRGTIRVLPKKDSMAFVSCDRGSLEHDVMLCDKMAINRALDGDRVFVEILPLENDNDDDGSGAEGEENVVPTTTLADYMEGLELGDNADNENQAAGDVERMVNGIDCEDNGEDVVLSAEDFEDYDIEENNNGDMNNEARNLDEEKNDTQAEAETWQDDQVQMSLWNPSVKVRKAPTAPPVIGTEGNGVGFRQPQRAGRVVCVIPPKGGRRPASELRPGDDDGKGASGTKATDDQTPRRTIVGTIGELPGDNNSRYLFTPNNKSLPQFLCPAGFHRSLEKFAVQEGVSDSEVQPSSENGDNATSVIYRAEYKHGTWKANMRWPPCSNVKPIGGSCDIEGETTALLAEFGVDHGDFEPEVLRDVEEAVRSGREKVVNASKEKNGEGTAAASDLGWKPTPDMYKGRRDYRKERIFTIDPTTAKDLDDALHIKPLPDGRVEIGVHIADVSHFVAPDTAVDIEAMRRATTVYLVDRTIPMLPRPLCEIACSLNENVERLAFSCVWRMNMDGTMKGKKQTSDDVWYGRTVIKSCARLDYATAQNIIEGKVANGEKPEEVDVNLWPQSRQPTGGHTIDEVAGDVRLMHRVAQARRALRFQNGALALNGVKLAFQLVGDGEAPELCEPYPIRDSNRLVEEYMLLANYLVAERLIAYAGDRALLRMHPPPLEKGLENVVDVARESVGFHIDASTSQSLQESLSRMGRECNDELVMQCVTELAMVPMQPAQYLAAGTVEQEQWRHFALNIPYYTHFTSPIRRYADVMVHRLLQATIDDTIDEDDSLRDESEIQKISEHCNEKRMASKKAQERSDRVFLSLFLRAKPIQNVLGVVLSVGEKTFTIFVPSLGLNTLVFVDEHKDRFDVRLQGEQGKRQILLQPKDGPVVGQGTEHRNSQVRVKVFAKLKVSCYCKEKAPIDVKVLVEGNWKNN